MPWTGPGFVDHHTHLLRVSAGGVPGWAAEPGGLAAFHRRLAAQGTTPMDVDSSPLAHERGEPLQAALEVGLQRARDLGLCQVTEAGLGSWDEWDAVLALRAAGRLPLRVHALVAAGLADRSGGPAALAARRTGDPWTEIEGIKLYGDGWLGPRTCALCAPFADAGERPELGPDDRGVLFLDGPTVARRAGPYLEAGLAVAIHAIGDRAVEAALAGFAAVLGGERPAIGFARIEHAQVLRPDLVAAFGDLGVTACIQPSFAASDAEAALVALGPARARQAYDWSALLAAGAPVITGADFPIEDLSPIEGLRDLVGGRGTGCPTLPFEAALDLMTDAEMGTTTWSYEPSRATLDHAVVTAAHPA